MGDGKKSLDLFDSATLDAEENASPLNGVSPRAWRPLSRTPKLKGCVETRLRLDRIQIPNKLLSRPRARGSDSGRGVYSVVECAKPRERERERETRAGRGGTSSCVMGVWSLWPDDDGYAMRVSFSLFVSRSIPKLRLGKRSISVSWLELSQDDGSLCLNDSFKRPLSQESNNLAKGRRTPR